MPKKHYHPSMCTALVSICQQHTILHSASAGSLAQPVSGVTCSHSHVPTRHRKKHPLKKGACTYQKRAEQEKTVLSQLKTNCQPGLIKSPHRSLYMFCSPQPGRGLNRLLTRVKTEPHLPCVTRLLNTHG